MKDLSTLSQKLRKFHREVWQYHDLEAFENLESSIHTLLKLLGFDHQPAKEAADCIKSAYICADKAVDAMEVENRVLEMRWYSEAAVQLKCARILLNLREDGGEYEVKWWRAFRHRDWLEVGKLLFEELFIHSNDPEFALFGAYFLMAATRAHSERKWMEVGTLLGYYWSQVLERGYLFLAGGL